MAYVIGFAGKGGTGKTSTAALTVRYIIEHRRGPVLAVDADSNACLNEALGIEVHATIGHLREESLDAVRGGGQRPGGMSMEQLFDYQVQQSVIEGKDYDLMVMGRPEGPGCYCAANNIIRKYTDKLSENYPYVVIDNEAGMEHLSRRTTHAVDLLLIVSDPTVKGVQTARRINSLVDELNLDVKRRAVIINRIGQDDIEGLKAYAKSVGVDIYATIPNDPMIMQYDLKGLPVMQLPPDAASVKAVYAALDSLNLP